MAQIDIEYAGRTYTVPWTDDNVERLKGIAQHVRDGAIVNTCGSRSLRGLRSGRFVGAFDEFAVLECCAGTNERDQVRRVDGAPA